MTFHSRYCFLTVVLCAAFSAVAFSAAVERVIVDFKTDVGPVTYRGSGFLNGYGLSKPTVAGDGSKAKVEEGTPYAPGDEWVIPLKPQALSTHPDNWSVDNADGLFDIYDHARKIGVKYIQVKISDRYGYGYNKIAPWPGDNGNWKLWEDCVEDMVKEVLRKKMIVQWDIVNEPNPGGFWSAPGGSQQYFEAWKHAVVKIRELDPKADIIGPGMAGFHPEFLKDFLSFCKKNNVLPNVLMWHDAGRFSENVKYAKLLLAKEGIDIKRFAISEYTGPANSNNAGYSAMAFADLERAKVESACRTVNNDAMAPDVNIAIHHTLGGLLTPKTFIPSQTPTTQAGASTNPASAAVGAFRPRATWWVFKRYADMTGRLVQVTPAETTDGLAAWDATAGKATILLGRCAPETAATGIEVVCTNPAILASITENGKIRVVGERIKNSGWEPLEKPEIVMDTLIPVDTVLKIPVSPMGPADAFFVTLCKPSKDCAMIAPTPIKQAKAGQPDYLAVRTAGVKVDGDLGDWAKANFIDLAKSGNVKIWMYQGVKDLSGKVAFTWDGTNFYVAAELTDDALVGASSFETMYMGDCIQLAMRQQNTGTGWFEITLGNMVNSQPKAYCFIAPTPDHATGVMKDVQLIVKRQATTTIYEAAIPWKTLAPMDPKTERFTLSMVINDNDGTGRKGWIEWGSGIAEEKAPSKFMPCQFVK